MATTFAVDIPAKGQVTVIERELADDLLPGQALINVTACGFCGGDIERYEGRADFAAPFELGHEMAGVVEQVGPALVQADDAYPFRPAVPKVKVGDLVTGWVIGGGMAGHVIAEVRNLRPVPVLPEPLEHPAVHGEPLSCVVNTLRLAPPNFGDDVVVVGAGFMALVTARLASFTAGRVIVAARRPVALERAARWGATHTVDLSKRDLADEVRRITGGSLARLTYEVTGAQQGLDLAYQATGENGRVVVEGFHQHGTRQVNLGQQAIDGQQMDMAHFRPLWEIRAGLDQGLALTARGRLQLDELVTHPVGIEQVGEAFAIAAARPDDYVKAVVQLS